MPAPALRALFEKARLHKLNISELVNHCCYRHLEKAIEEAIEKQQATAANPDKPSFTIILKAKNHDHL